MIIIINYIITGEENIIIGVAGNKCDLFQEEQVTEEEAKKFADSIGAIFKLYKWNPKMPQHAKLF